MDLALVQYFKILNHFLIILELISDCDNNSHEGQFGF